MFAIFWALLDPVSDPIRPRFVIAMEFTNSTHIDIVVADSGSTFASLETHFHIRLLEFRSAKTGAEPARSGHNKKQKIQTII